MNALTRIQKGDILESCIRHLLEYEGYEVYTAQRTMKAIGNNRFISKSVDIFGCDLIGRHPTRKVCFAQVTGWKASHEKQKVTESKFWNFETTDVLYYRYRTHVNGPNDFLVNQNLGESVWPKVGEIPVTMKRFFVPANEFIRRKPVTIEAVCSYLKWSKPDFVAMRKATK